MDYKQASQVLDAAIRKLMTDRGLSYVVAAEVLKQEQPKLWDARQVIWVREYRKRENAKLQNVEEVTK